MLRRLLLALLERIAPDSLGVSLDCRDGVHGGCIVCDCSCHLAREG